jgi:hypothetical protein
MCSPPKSLYIITAFIHTTNKSNLGHSGAKSKNILSHVVAGIIGFSSGQDKLSALARHADN